jgi:hypothetical protein
MRATILAFLMLIVAVFGSGTALAADPTAPGEAGGAIPIVLSAGEALSIGRIANVISPARNPICDDVKVATVVDTPEGPAFKGISPGRTLCSVSGGAFGVRQLFEITVR